MIKLRLICLFSVLLILLSCNLLLFKTKTSSKFSGVDPQIEPYVNEWFDLATLYGLKFNNEVTIGFDTINVSNVVAECEYGLGFREITVDPTYWNNMDFTDRMAVLFHELNHCYCNEGHQFGKKHTEYDKDGNNPPEGFFSDSCPKSFMYPYTVYEGCVQRHFTEYVDDMFENCKPY
jgi:hypothetical protein